ncbi:MAG: hypothetical protein PF961_00215 [Planctomycetota bacterium]|jgi:hypothetical protein|nr:hypothetical protein [Planctomycetota bacterium]
MIRVCTVLILSFMTIFICGAQEGERSPAYVSGLVQSAILVGQILEVEQEVRLQLNEYARMKDAEVFDELAGRMVQIGFLHGGLELGKLIDLDRKIVAALYADRTQMLVGQAEVGAMTDLVAWAEGNDVWFTDPSQRDAFDVTTKNYLSFGQLPLLVIPQE